MLTLMVGISVAGNARAARPRGAQRHGIPTGRICAESGGGLVLVRLAGGFECEGGTGNCSYRGGLVGGARRSVTRAEVYFS